MAILPRHPPVYVTNLTDLAGGGSLATSANQQTLITAIGTPSDPAWNGTSPSATVISLLKAIAQNTSVS